jgi:hypothetical protein
MKRSFQESVEYPYDEVMTSLEGGQRQFYLPRKGQRIFAALLDSSDDAVSCPSRMIDTSTVTPSFFTVRESPDLTILGSRSIIAASTFGAVLFDGARAF